MHVIILGNSAGGPFHGRHYTAQLVQSGPHAFLIDCGEGTQMQLFRYRVRQDLLRQIFISHLHGDHVFGLMGLLTNWCLKKRTEPLQLFSPPGLRELVETNARLCSVRFPYPIEFVEVDASVHEKVFENTALSVWSIPLQHRIPCSGWLFREKERPRNIRKEAIETYNIHYSLIPGIKAGGDLVLPDGHIVPHLELTLPAAPPHSYAFCSDTQPSEAVAAVVKGVDLLYHEATFTNENPAEAILSGHSTAAQAADIARQAGVKRLLLGHFSGRYTDESQHLMEAQAIFPDTLIAEEGQRWPVGSGDPEQLQAYGRQTAVPAAATAAETPRATPLEDARLVKISKFVSKVLRHQPHSIDLVLDANGWAEVAELIEKAGRARMHFDLDTLRQVVAQNNKQRFAFNEDGSRIRANQGHSIAIDLGLSPQTPPDILFHGTSGKSLAAIRETGLRPMKRQHVHLSLDRQTATNVGGRHGKAVVLRVRAKEMAEAGALFYCSENGVWLTETVGVGFIDFGI